MVDLESALHEVQNDEEWAADVDFSGTDENIPAGKYAVTVKSSKKGQSKSSNKPQVVLTCVITEGKFQGRYLYAYLGLDAKVLWKTRKLLAGLGIAIEGDSFRISPQILDGKEATAEVTKDSSEFNSIANFTQEAASNPLGI